MASISNSLMYLHYDPEITPHQLIEEHLRFGAEIPDVPRPQRQRHEKIRIGYVSADFKSHACACFLLPLLQTHDRERFEIYCYANNKVDPADDVTDRFKACGSWRSIVDLSNDDAKALIVADGIDVLIDCSGHTSGKRISLFAMRPAPVSMTYLGYPDTTGLKQIDYRISDGVADPLSEGNAYASEELVRLPHGFHTFNPLIETFAPSDPPCIRNGYITFGSFNNRTKVNDDVLRLWGQILQAVPGSKLLIKNKGWIGRPYLGVAPDRIIISDFTLSREQHFAAYGAVDISLDTYPYNGTTTTCDALWMGVPVVALRGTHHAARVSASLLTHLGQTEMIAETPDDYVQLAVRLANDRLGLVQRRKTLRAAFLNSPLGNPEIVTRDIEALIIEALQKLDSGPLA